MKGQQVFEFIVVTVLFIGIMIFVLNTLNMNAVVYTGEYFAAATDSKAIAVSEALLKTTGSVGLVDPVKNGWPVLDGGKMGDFQLNCETDYAAVLNNLDLGTRPGVGGGYYRVWAEVKDVEGATVMTCKPPLSSEIPKNVGVAAVRRIALSEAGEPLELNVWVWFHQQ